jgi:regulator of sigma D
MPIAGSGDGSISYDPGLISKLKDDHKKLVGIFTAIVNAYNASQYDKIPQLLGDFKVELQAHLVLENIKFYVRVQQQHAHDAENSEYIAELRKEMDGIARTVRQFINRYVNERLNDSNKAEFKATLDTIGSVLVRRIENEENTLYKLYA